MGARKIFETGHDPQIAVHLWLCQEGCVRDRNIKRRFESRVSSGVPGGLISIVAFGSKPDFDSMKDVRKKGGDLR